MTLKCVAEGKPMPSVIWTRPFDNSVVTMPLVGISRHDVRDYRCTAQNGVGNPDIRNITIDVQCEFRLYIYMIMHAHVCYR